MFICPKIVNPNFFGLTIRTCRAFIVEKHIGLDTGLIEDSCGQTQERVQITGIEPFFTDGFTCTAFKKDVVRNDYGASLCRDINGNTLLHAALLRAVYAYITSLFKTDNPYRNRYDFLLENGCRSDVKNEAGFSCDDLLKILKENVELFSDIVNFYG